MTPAPAGAARNTRTATAGTLNPIVLKADGIPSVPSAFCKEKTRKTIPGQKVFISGHLHLAFFSLC